MTFPEALAHVFDHDHHIRRTFWSSGIFVGLEDGRLCIRGYLSTGPDDGKWHPWVITEEDYFADDWEVVE